jgi:hypothetical protein
MPNNYGWRSLFASHRGVGNTRAAAAGAKALNGVVVVGTAAQAHLIKHYGAEAIAVYSWRYLLGRKVPVVFDVTAVDALLAEAECEIEGLKKEVRDLQSRLYNR